MTGLDLGQQHEHRSARDVGSRPQLAPGPCVSTELNRGAHNLVIGGMVGDLVDAMAVAVVGLKPRRVGVGLIRPALEILRADQPAGLVQALARPARVVALHALRERQVKLKLVHTNARDALVEHLVRG